MELHLWVLSLTKPHFQAIIYFQLSFATRPNENKGSCEQNDVFQLKHTRKGFRATYVAHFEHFLGQKCDRFLPYFNTV